MTIPDWHPPAASGPLDATVTLPGSKSLTNRFLVLAALATETSRLRRPLRSRDTELMAQALRQLGAGVDDATSSASALSVPDWIIHPASLRGGGSVDCGLAGTVMRFLPPVAALCDGPVAFDGDEPARVRPMAAIIGALRDLGVSIEDEGGTLPFVVRGSGSVRGGRVVLDASASSQFISALLLAAPRFEEGITVVHEGEPLPSVPHIEMTVEALRDAGAEVDDSEPSTWRVEPGELLPLDVIVEPDLSNAAPFLAAAAVTDGTVRVPDWPQHTTQAGDRIRDILDQMGADVTLDGQSLTVSGDGRPSGVDIDLHDAAELTPVVAALAACADGPTIIRGVGHIRGHETDRIAALSRELGAFGAGVTEREDGLRIDPAPLRPATFHTYADHRMVMAGAVLSVVTPGSAVADPGAVAKTLPGFVGLWESMLETAAG